MMKVILDNSKAQQVKHEDQVKQEMEARVDTHKNYGKVPNYINRYNQ
jgi:hypothetical protein